LKEQDFVPWKLSLRLDRLAYILGIHIPKKDVFTILKKLNLLPRSVKKNIIETSIPTYRNDLQIEEDLIEEVARLYGYNNFPKTMIEGEIAKTQIPFYKNYKKEEEIKHIIQSVGFNEVYTYSLVSKTDLVQFDISPKKTLKVANPVSQDFEYLRPTLRINLFKALRENKANFSEISIFELGKVYLGEKITQAKETYFLSGISNTKNYFEIKGMLEAIFSSFSISEDPSPYITIFDEGIFFELDFSLLLLKKAKQKVFQPIPKYPSITEDLACIVPSHIKIGDIITLIRKQSILVVEVSLLDTFKDTRTFHIVYQNKQKNLTNEDVGKIRKKIISALLSNLQVKLKE
jgi:phenylalanyl-tRNA synthetase beta chain